MRTEFFKIALIGLLTVFAAGSVDAEDRKVMTIGAYSVPNTPWDLNWQDVSAAFEANKDLGLDLELLVRGETGSSEERLNSLRRNRLQFVSSPLGSGAAMIPELGVLQLPFLFESTPEADFVLDEYALPRFQEMFDEKGIMFLRWTEAGSNHLFGDRPFLTPDTVKSFPMRVQTTKASSVYFEGLEADAVYMSSNDIVQSLQTGLISGGEAVTIFYWMTGIFTEAKHFTMTGHAIEPSSILLNKKFWESLSPEQQTLVSTAYPGPKAARNRVREWMTKVEADLPDLGVTLHRLNDEQRAAWTAQAQSSYDAILESIGGDAEDIYKLVLEGQAAYARMKDKDS
ncbi:MAG: TRAP transporter substrate-binding protein [Rhodospirillaceae bacterium]|jgi:TRAP-type transport system periplasmic protein|nr:TRAP transporter substrate-binding protein [Rhodospirillaceae bacterium]MBT5565071.1 TRAP transporter substrate-binding protein [Rhodospirillaceae bacterium]MBT6088093.1 TRAP transporter substrate-binding protein [Rhodospirillaceae bacterium]